MKKLLISTLVIISCLGLKAQYNPQVSHFMYDNLRVNPGSAGSRDMVNITGLIRQDMVEFPGNPDNFFFEVEAPFKLGETKHGAGLTLYRDSWGFNADICVNLNYAFRFTVNDGTLGVGINAGFLDNSLNANWVTMDESDAGIPTTDGADDPVLTLGGGLFYQTEDLYFGVSVLNINTPEVSYSSTDVGITEANYNLSMHYYVTAGYNMQLPNPAWELKPAVLLKSDARSTDLDVNLSCVYNKKFWAGVSYRTGEAVVGMVGIELIEGLKVGYSYDVQTTAIMNYSQGSHEILLNYSFKLDAEKEPQKYKSIRFL